MSDPGFGDVCSLECEQSGFKITPPGLKEVTCSSDQTWTGEVEQAQCVGENLFTVFAGDEAAVFLEEKISNSRGAAFTLQQQNSAVV